MNTKLIAAAAVAVVSGATIEPVNPIDPSVDLPFHLEKRDLVQIVGGIIIQLLHSNHLTELGGCFTYVEEDGVDAWAVFQDSKTKDMTHALDAVVHIGNILVRLPETTRPA